MCIHIIYYYISVLFWASLWTSVLYVGFITQCHACPRFCLEDFTHSLHERSFSPPIWITSYTYLVNLHILLLLNIPILGALYPEPACLFLKVTCFMFYPWPGWVTFTFPGSCCSLKNTGRTPRHLLWASLVREEKEAPLQRPNHSLRSQGGHRVNLGCVAIFIYI